MLFLMKKRDRQVIADANNKTARGYDEHQRNWLDMPIDLAVWILSRLNPADIFGSVQLVCKTWFNLCKDPSMWKSINLTDPPGYHTRKSVEALCCSAVDRSRGGLVNITLAGVGSDFLLMYVADRASELRCLKFVMSGSSTEKGFIEAVVKLPLLEDLELSLIDVSGNALKAVGNSCPRLKSLRRNYVFSNRSPNRYDEDAFAIAETMPGLRHLQLIGNTLTDNGLYAILNHCPHLELLDLTQCSNINLARMGGKLEILGTDQIKDLKLAK